ncbi:nucleotide-diphospho-sugar transferase [Cryphonectria parasitica EP155]|uniref:Mannose-1-phosphate guanyltransferase n=1 Tax=Cryphonectria parasitica (strain ATCC 38755 / EP155) TaxID=660469 RepID=A0A9P4XW03_CRYP1|nr:nucleotide-diphospho-sugar transferase [Cryphonectria parasitica EP155]KAF3761926.1 nucleotide-diphospho-sugar transferase [Cryphonectria parasitica EP155]
MSLQVPHRAKPNGSDPHGATKAVILVGGASRGTRFRPLSLDVPKPLFDVAGHPIIYHCLTAVSKVPSVHEVYLIGYYDESVFRDFIKDASSAFPNLSIKYLREYQALGTAGGLYHFRDAILKGKPERLFVLNSDVCCSFPLNEMLHLFNEKYAEAVILGTRVGDDAATNFGCIVSDSHTKRVLHYVEKPEGHLSNLINCGVYLFSTDVIFPSIKSAIKRRADRPRLSSYRSTENLESSYVFDQEDDDDDESKNQIIRLEQDILSDMADSKQFFVYETKDFWRQIKTAGSAVPANALYLQQAWQNGSEELATPSANIIPPVFIHPSAQVDPTAKLGPNVSIGPRATIGRGARVKESIVLEDAEIKHDALVMYSIVGWNSRVGAWARVEGTPTPVTSHSTSIVKNGLKVQAITILGKECGVHDEVRVQNCVCLPYKELKRDVTSEVIM